MTAIAELEQVAREICFWSEPSTCHDAYCCSECIAVRPDECWWRAARAVIALRARQAGGDDR